MAISNINQEDFFLPLPSFEGFNKKAIEKPNESAMFEETKIETKAEIEKFLQSPLLVIDTPQLSPQETVNKDLDKIAQDAAKELQPVDLEVLAEKITQTAETKKIVEKLETILDIALKGSAYSVKESDTLGQCFQQFSVYASTVLSDVSDGFLGSEKAVLMLMVFTKMTLANLLKNLLEKKKKELEQRIKEEPRVFSLKILYKLQIIYP